jgi:DNA-binding transcriptional LysR family regulator
MKLSYLREYIVLAECKNFSTAAKFLFITQPALSRHLFLIEEELGVKLIERDTRSMALTKAGESFLKGAQTIIQQYEKTITEVQNISSGIETTLTIGFLNGVASELLAPLSDEFCKLYPKVKLNLRAYDYGDVNKALLLDGIDLILTQRLDTPHNSEIDFVDLYNDPMVCLLPFNHPLAECDEIALIELKNENFLISEESRFPGYNAQIEKICMIAGFKPLIGATVSQVELGSMLIESGKVISIAPVHLKKFINPKLPCVKIKDTHAYTVISAAYKKGHSSPLLFALITMIQSIAEKKEPQC